MSNSIELYKEDSGTATISYQREELDLQLLEDDDVDAMSFERSFKKKRIK